MTEMAGGMQQIGIEAIFQSVEFIIGLKQYSDALTEADKKTETAAGSMTQSMTDFDKNTNNVAQSVVDSFQGISLGALTLATTLGNLLAGAISNAVGWVINLGKEGLQSAARVQELDYVLQILAPRANTTVEALRDEVDAIKALGIQTDVAQNLLQQFIRYKLDLTQAEKLARVAQDTAVLSMASSSDELQRILWGIQTYNTHVLRTAGLNINMAQAFKDYAQELHKTTGELTQTEKQQAALNAVLKEGERNAGMYEAAMEAPGKQLRSLTRDMYELGRTIAEPFLGAFGEIVTTGREIAKTWQKLLDDGGALRPLMIQIGGAAELAAQYFRQFALWISNTLIAILTGQNTFINQFTEGFNSGFEAIANMALEWGKAIIGFLAQGMAWAEQEVVNVLIGLGDLIASWLAPHSPPKILPELEQWGQEAMTIYLQGWSSADFSVFNDIASVFETYLKALGKSNIPEKDLIPMILGGREAIAEAINQVRESGQITNQVLDDMMSKLGPVSAAVRDYAQSTLEMQAITMQLTDAQQELNDVTDYYDTIISALNAELKAETQQYDDQLRLQEIQKAIGTGRLTEAEKAKLQNEANAIMLKEQIAAAELAKDQDVAAAKAKVDSLKSQQDAIKAQLDASKALIDSQDKQNQLIQQQIDLLTRLNSEKGKGAGAGEEETGLGEGGIPAISDKLKAEIDAAAAKMKESLETWWAGIKLKFDTWVNDFKTRFVDPVVARADEIKKAWQPVWDALSEFYTTKLKPAWDSFWGWVSTTVWPIIQNLITWATTHPDQLLKVAGGITAVYLAWQLFTTVAGAGLSVLGSIASFVFTVGPALIWFAANWEVVTGIVAGLVAGLSSLLGIVAIVAGVFTGFIIGVVIPVGIAILALTNNWFGLRDAAFKVWDFLKNTWWPFLKSIADVLFAIVGKALEALVGGFQHLFEWVGKVLVQFGESTGLTKVLNTVWDSISKVAKIVSGEFSEAWTSITNWFNDHVAPAFTTVKDTIGKITEFLTGLADKIRNLKLPAWLTPGSPTPFEMGLRGIADALREVNQIGMGGLTLQSSLSPSPTSSYQNVSSTSYYNKTIQINMTPSYQNVQSPSSIYYDVSAALASARV